MDWLYIASYKRLPTSNKSARGPRAPLTASRHKLTDVHRGKKGKDAHRIPVLSFYRIGETKKVRTKNDADPSRDIPVQNDEVAGHQQTGANPPEPQKLLLVWKKVNEFLKRTLLFGESSGVLCGCHGGSFELY